MSDLPERAKNAEVITWAHDELGIAYKEIGRVVRASERTVLRWRGRETLASQRHRARLQSLDRLKHLLSRVFQDPQGASEWLRSPVPALGSRTPISYLRAGKLRPVLEVLASFDAGVFV
ncbi:MAG TPA: antitoxin Xre/MbcA/ParS toxin-binding domain-containing protein [Longimicrobium sp.]